jgi:hypothetical protein
MLIWTAVMLLPTLLATDAPHFLRAAGVLPMAMFFPALALEAVWTRIPRGRAWAAASLALSLLFTTRDYFGRYLSQPETRYAFETAAADLSAQTNALLSDESQRQVYLDKQLWDSFASLRFLLARQPALQIFDPAAPPVMDANTETLIIVWPHADPQAALAGRPEAVVVRAEAGPPYRGDKEATPYSLFTMYTLAPAPAEWPAPLAVFERGVILQSVVVTPTASGLHVALLWRAQEGVWQTGGPDYHVFVQWRGPTEAVLAQDDAPAARALYPTAWWRGGEAVWDLHELTLASTERPPESELIIGMYDYPSLTRLQLLTGPGDFVGVPVP